LDTRGSDLKAYFHTLSGPNVPSYQVKDDTIAVNRVDFQIRSLKDRQQFFDQDKRAADLGILSATGHCLVLCGRRRKVLLPP